MTDCSRRLGILHLQSLALSSFFCESDLQYSTVLPLWGDVIYIFGWFCQMERGERPKVLALLLRYHYWTRSARLIQLALQYRYIYSTSNVPSFLSTTKTPNTKSSKKTAPPNGKGTGRIRELSLSIYVLFCSAIYSAVRSTILFVLPFDIVLFYSAIYGAHLNSPFIYSLKYKTCFPVSARVRLYSKWRSVIESGPQINAYITKCYVFRNRPVCSFGGRWLAKDLYHGVPEA